MLVWASQCKIQKDSTGCGRLETLKVTDAQITWLAFLAAKRDTYIMPTPNCMGYLQNQRSDQGHPLSVSLDFTQDHCRRGSQQRLPLQPQGSEMSGIEYCSDL
jgi:hypothetical protein